MRPESRHCPALGVPAQGHCAAVASWALGAGPSARDYLCIGFAVRIVFALPLGHTTFCRSFKTFLATIWMKHSTLKLGYSRQGQPLLFLGDNIKAVNCSVLCPVPWRHTHLPVTLRTDSSGPLDRAQAWSPPVSSGPCSLVWTRPQSWPLLLPAKLKSP